MSDHLDELDDPIGDVAKEMTTMPQDARFAARVSMRIAGAGARRPLWSRPWVWLPAASACVLAVVVAVGRPFQGRHSEAERPASPQTAAAGPSALYGARDARPRALPFLLPPPAIEPIEVDRLDVQPLVEMDEIEISPIAIDRIEISAMP